MDGSYCLRGSHIASQRPTAGEYRNPDAGILLVQPPPTGSRSPWPCLGQDCCCFQSIGDESGAAQLSVASAPLARLRLRARRPCFGHELDSNGSVISLMRRGGLVDCKYQSPMPEHRVMMATVGIEVANSEQSQWRQVPQAKSRTPTARRVHSRDGIAVGRDGLAPIQGC